MNADNLKLLVWITFFLSLMRFFIQPSPITTSGSYQALAHLFVGGLIGAWLATQQKWYGFFAIVLILVEVVAFFVTGNK